MFVGFAPRDNANASELTVNVKCARPSSTHVHGDVAIYIHSLKFIAAAAAVAAAAAASLAHLCVGRTGMARTIKCK